MSHQSPNIPDPFDFARRRLTLEGRADACDLPRLAQVVSGHGQSQPVQYTLAGRSVDDKLFIDIVVSAELLMQCQRCLEDKREVVTASTSLLLVPDKVEIPDEELEVDEYDAVHAGRDFDVIGAVEEELLLALPLAPTHADCTMPVAKENGGERSPFAQLAVLKSKGSRES